MDYFEKAVMAFTGTTKCFAQLEVYGDWYNPRTQEVFTRWTVHLHIPKGMYRRPLNEVLKKLLEPSQDDPWEYQGGNAAHCVVLQVKMGTREHKFEVAHDGTTQIGWGGIS